MRERIPRVVQTGVLALALAACGTAPSRTPLGGNYALVDSEPARDLRAQASDGSSSASEADAVPEAQVPPPALPAAFAIAAASAQATKGDALVYEPFKRGQVIAADVTISFKAALSGGHAALPGNGELGLDGKFHVAIEITQASVQTLDELTLTLTPLAMHSEFSGKIVEMPPGSAKTFEVTLGRSASVRIRGGGKPDAEERAVLMVLITPLAEFQEHWVRSPSLELTPDYSSQVPVSVPEILGRSSDTVHVGPFRARYTGRDASAGVPFQIALPIDYRTDMGALDFDLTGSARLSDNQARPIAVDLSGAVDGGGGPQHEIEFHGRAKLTATLSYP